MAETKEEREQREKQERERQQKERERQERERQEREKTKKAGDKDDGEPEKVGNPMREDDQMNQFRAPDAKPMGAFYGEDMTQPRARAGEEIEGLPPDTHAQKPGPQAEEEEEEEETTGSRKR